MSDAAAPASSFTALTELHRSTRSLEQVVAWRGTDEAPRPLRFGRFLADVAHFADRLESAGLGADDRVALWCPDAYAFAVGLLGAWQRACIVVSPPNDAVGTFEAIAASGCRIACDAPERRASDPALSLAFALEDRSGGAPDAALLRVLRDAPPLAREAPALELSTSGTTGDGKAIPKRIRHLDDEVFALERHFGVSIGSDARIVATPSHQHLYGLLFRVLWPLCSGRPFHAQGALQAEEVLAAAGEREPFALVSVPAHLSRIAQREGARRLARACVRVFSSGGPLAPETAALWRSFGVPAPTEIFGSTETGGVAFREQEGAPEFSARTPWQPFAGVRIARDARECLVVTSPFVSGGTSDGRGGDERFAMGDRASLSGDGRFVLLGRADRTVKIGERRLSLPEMEARLVAQPGVSEAALVTIEVAAEERVAAAVVPIDPGLVDADPEARRAFGRQLGNALARDFDRVLLPRAWRFVAALPEDAQGKRTTAALRRLFGASREPAPRAGSADRGDSIAHSTRADHPNPADHSDSADHSAPGGGSAPDERSASGGGSAPGDTSVPGECFATTKDHAAATGASSASSSAAAPASAARPREPRLIEERRHARGAEWLCEVPADLAHLDGHFPGRPLVPAVAQLGWALGFAAREAGEALAIASVEQLRLREALRPGDRFWLRIEWAAAPGEAHSDTRAARELGFSLTSDNPPPGRREFASGRLVVERE